MIVPGTISFNSTSLGTVSTHVIITAAQEHWDTVSSCNAQLVRTLRSYSTTLGSPQLWSAVPLFGQQIVPPSW